MNTDPLLATTMSPAVHWRFIIPHVPSLMAAIGPSTTSLISLITKSIMGTPMPVATRVTGTPLKVPVKVLNVLVDTTLTAVSGLSKNLDSFQAL